MFKVSPFFIIASLISMASSVLYAGTVSVMNMSGSVPMEISIAIENTSGASGIDLSQGVTGLHVGDVRITSNSSTGFEVLIHSLNGGVMKHSTNNQAQIAYTLASSLQGGATSSYNLNTDKTFGDEQSKVQDLIMPIYFSSSANLVNDISSSNSNIKSSSQMLAGSYSDTITVTISAL